MSGSLTRPAESLAAEAAFRREIAPWALLGLTLGLVEGATAAVLIKKTFAGRGQPVDRESRRGLREWRAGVVQRHQFRVGQPGARPDAHPAHGGAAGRVRAAGGVVRRCAAGARRPGLCRRLDPGGARDLDRDPHGARRGVERELSARRHRPLHRPHRDREFAGGVGGRGAGGLGAGQGAHRSRAGCSARARRPACWRPGCIARRACAASLRCSREETAAVGAPSRSASACCSRSSGRTRTFANTCSGWACSAAATSCSPRSWW